MSVLAMGFVACDEYDEAIPQANEQKPIVEVKGLEVAPAEALSTPIDLNAATAPIELIKTVKTPVLNENNSIAYDVQIASDENFTKMKQYPLTDGAIDPYDLDAAFRQLYGKTPNQKPLYFRFIPYLTDGESRVLFEKDVYLLSSKNEVKPVDMGIVVESAYYVLTDIWFGDGWADNMIKFNHSGADRYDDPIFKATVEFEPEIDPETGEEKFEPKTLQIIGEESVAKAKEDPEQALNYVWGPAGEGETGDLAFGEKAGVITIAEAGMYTITIDMLYKTYSIQKVMPTMYMIGQHTNWDWTKAIEMVPGNQNGKTEGKYWCIAYVGAGTSNGFKFNTAADWDGGEFGYGGATLVSHVAGVNFVDDGGNIAVDKAGWYLFGVEKKEGNAGYEFTVNIFPPDVYVYGNTNGGIWGDDPNWKFSVPTDANGEFVSPALAMKGELRLCVHPLTTDGAQWIGDWWQSEFIFFNGEIAYRGQGGDQDRVNVEAGQKVYLNFTTGKARVE